MKILMIAPQPFFQPRGTPFSVLHRLKALSTLGHQVDLVTYHIGEDRMVPGVRIIRCPRFRFISKMRIGFSPAKVFLLLVLTWIAIKRTFQNRYDLVHTHEEAVFIGILLRLFRRIPHLYDMHSSLPEQFINYGTPGGRLLQPLLRGFEWLAIRGSDAVIAICPRLAERVCAVRPQCKVAVIENTALTDELPPPRLDQIEQYRNQYGVSGRIVFLYSGTLELNQGIDLFLQAVAMVAQDEQAFVVMLVGGREDQVASVKTLRDQLHLQNTVILAGQRPIEEMPLFNALADVMVSPRCIGGNTPLKIYSYMESGTAILATRLDTHTQVLDDDTAMLVPSDADGLAAGMRTLMSDRNLRTRLGQAARQRYLERYHRGKYVSRIAAILEQVSG